MIIITFLYKKGGSILINDAAGPINFNEFNYLLISAINLTLLWSTRIMVVNLLCLSQP